MNSLIYVEKNLIVPIAVKLVGSSLSFEKKLSEEVGFNWFVSASIEDSSGKTIQTKIAELFPEDIFYHIYNKIEKPKLSIRSLCENISSGTLCSASVISVVGQLNIPKVDVKPYNPFKPPKISITETFKIYGEECFSAEIIDNGYKFPVFFLINSKEIVCYANRKPVEIIGVLKWSPSHDVGGFPINQLLLGAALLLRK